MPVQRLTCMRAVCVGLQAAPTHLCLLSPSQIQDTAKDLLVRLDLLQVPLCHAVQGCFSFCNELLRANISPQ